MMFFTLLSYSALYFALAFLALCLATGLYYLSELAEEYTVLTKKILKYTIIAVISCHVFLWLLDDFPFSHVLIGIASHVTYQQLLKSFPFFQWNSYEFIGSIAAFVIEHIMWFRYFTSSYSNYYPMTQILGFFFFMVWVVPMSFFITLSINELTLPGGLSLNHQGGVSMANAEGSDDSAAASSSSSAADVLSNLKPKRVRVVRWLVDNVNMDMLRRLAEKDYGSLLPTSSIIPSGASGSGKRNV